MGAKRPPDDEIAHHTQRASEGQHAAERIGAASGELIDRNDDASQHRKNNSENAECGNYPPQPGCLGKRDKRRVRAYQHHGACDRRVL